MSTYYEVWRWNVERTHGQTIGWARTRFGAWWMVAIRKGFLFNPHFRYEIRKEKSDG